LSNQLIIALLILSGVPVSFSFRLDFKPAYIFSLLLFLKDYIKNIKNLKEGIL